MAYLDDGAGWYDDENDGLEDRLQEDLESIRNSLSIFKVFFAFQPEVVLPAAPPETMPEWQEVRGWAGKTFYAMSAKDWYYMEEE